MRHILFTLLALFCCVAFIAGCDKSLDPAVSHVGSNDTSNQLTLSDDTIGRGLTQAATASQFVYGSKVERILSADKSNYDYLVTFYLPYNPGSAGFQGRAPWGWQTYAGSSAWVYDARSTSSGFRVIIRTTFSVVWWCSTVPSNYRLLY